MRRSKLLVPFGTEFLSQAAWNAYDNQLKEQACIDNRTNAQSQGVQGKYTYEPAPGPSPCGEVFGYVIRIFTTTQWI